MEWGCFGPSEAFANVYSDPVYVDLRCDLLRKIHFPLNFLGEGELALLHKAGKLCM